jgi:phosphonate transport system permease protein
VTFAVIVAWAWHGTGFELSRLAGSLAPLAEFLGRMSPPDMSTLDVAMKATAETLQMAVLGTFLAVVLSIPPALLAAANLTPTWIHQPVRWALALLRGIPLLLLALMFVAALGLGPVPGVLAIAVHSIGMLAKFYADAFESARQGPVEALDSAGANWLQRVRFGILTQVAPDLARDTLFRFELNLRESLVLGLVGAGGIGFYIQLYIRSFQYQRVATLTLVILVIVVLVEQGSVAIRRRLR